VYRLNTVDINTLNCLYDSFLREGGGTLNTLRRGGGTKIVPCRPQNSQFQIAIKRRNSTA